MGTNSIEEINNIQLYLIGGFMEYGGADEYRILPSKLFGVYEPLFVYLRDYGNARTPEFYDICSKIGNQTVVKAHERADYSFVSQRAKYARKLFDFHVSDELMQKMAPMDVLNSTRETYSKLHEIESGLTGGIEPISKLLHDWENEVTDAIENDDKEEGYKIGIKTIDDLTGGLRKGRTMRLSAYSNTGKSSFTYFVCNNVLKQGAKVLYFSLEVSNKEVRDRLISNWYRKPIDHHTKRSTFKDFDVSEYAENNLFLANKSHDIKDIELLIRAVKPDVVFIDYVQLIRGQGQGQYEKMTNIAYDLQRIILENNVALFDLSQVPNDSLKYQKGGIIPSKGSGELISSANQVLVMQPSKFDGLLELHLAKNRHGKKDVCIGIQPDFSICNFIERVIIDDIPQSGF